MDRKSYNQLLDETLERVFNRLKETFEEFDGHHFQSPSDACDCDFEIPNEIRESDYFWGKLRDKLWNEGIRMHTDEIEQFDDGTWYYYVYLTREQYADGGWVDGTEEKEKEEKRNSLKTFNAIKVSNLEWEKELYMVRDIIEEENDPDKIDEMTDKEFEYLVDEWYKKHPANLLPKELVFDLTNDEIEDTVDELANDNDDIKDIAINYLDIERKLDDYCFDNILGYIYNLDSAKFELIKK